MDLKQLRDGIDEIDGELLDLFLKRMELCRGVAKYKREHSVPVMQGGREKEILDRVRANTPEPEMKDVSAALFSTIMDISKILQTRDVLAEEPDYSGPEPDFEGANRIGCQGTLGANSETAARMIFGEKELIFYPTFAEVFDAVQSGELDYGVIPIHNSTAGSVHSTYDLMDKYSFYTVKRVTVEINHCLAANSDIKASEVSCVYSHRQALAQCGDYLASSGLRTSDYANTALAAEMVLASDPAEKKAAICSVECAKKLGLRVIAENISDCSLNRTQFACISRRLEVAPDADAISVMLRIPHEEGSLYRLLTKFFVNGMNLQRIENRPIRDGSFDVLFYLDFTGKLSDPAVKATLRDLERTLEYFRLLGAYKAEEE